MTLEVVLDHLKRSR